MSIEADPVPLVPFGGVELPLDRLAPHFLFVGASDSGKTLSIRMLMQAALQSSDGRLATRAIIYDGKRELYPVLIGMGFRPEDIKILCATDSRSVAWDMARDIHQIEHAKSVARNLIPAPEKYSSSSGKFFDMTAAGILGAIMMNLHRTRPGNWRLSDVVRIIRSTDETGNLLRKYRDTEQLYRDFLTGDPRTVDNIKATLTAEFTLKYESIATLWDRTSESVSLRHWCVDTAPSILLIAPDPTVRSIDAPNMAMFEFLAQELLKLEDARGPDAASRPRAWAVLDEFPFAGRVPLIQELCATVRSKGVRIVLSCQSLDGMTDVYGKDKAHDIINNMGNLAVMRLSNGHAASEMAKFFGEFESWENDFSESTTYTKSTFGVFNDSRSKTKSHSSRLVKRETVLPGELLSLLPVSPKNGLDGYFASTFMGAWRGPIPWSFVEPRLRPLADVPGHSPRPPEDFEPPDNEVPDAANQAHVEAPKNVPPARTPVPDLFSVPPSAPHPKKNDADDDLIVVD